MIRGPRSSSQLKRQDADDFAWEMSLCRTDRSNLTSQAEGEEACGIVASGASAGARATDGAGAGGAGGADGEGAVAPALVSGGRSRSDVEARDTAMGASGEMMREQARARVDGNGDAAGRRGGGALWLRFLDAHGPRFVAASEQALFLGGE